MPHSLQPSVVSLLGISLVSLSSLAAFTSPAQAVVLNGSFDSGLAPWQTTGDATLINLLDGTISPSAGSNQAIATNAFSNGSDDAGTAFNESGNDPVSPGDLELFLGLSPAASGSRFSIDPVQEPAFEGSAIKQENVTVTTDSFLRFDWNFLTNEPGSSFPETVGDYAFITLNDTLLRLADENSSLLGTSATAFSRETGYQSASIALSAGTYTIGFGAVDVSSFGTSSALLVDEVQLEPIPFEFSSLTGLFAVGSLWGLHALIQKLRHKTRQHS